MKNFLINCFLNISMYNIKNIVPRSYQEEIFETTKRENTLVCLPTGTGKTLNILLLAVYRLNKIKNSKVLIVSPTKPLNSQHTKTFKQNTTIPPEEIVLVTGLVNPKKRIELYTKRVIIATPQTIKEDILNNRLSIKDFSLLAIDEAHRAIGNYAYTFLTEKYLQEAEFPLILALTASPGGTKQKIEEIKDNLKIKAVEIRTEEDIKEFIQEKKIRWLEVTLPEQLTEISELIKNSYKEKLKDLKKIGFTKPVSIISKKDLIALQYQLRKNLGKKNPNTFYGIYLTALLIKLDYASELLETQGLTPLAEFWSKLQSEETKAAKSILNIDKIQKAISLTQDLIEKKVKHPKMYMLRGLIKKELEQNSNAKIIVFTNYRSTIDEILNFLKEEKVIKPVRLIGQKSGLTQKEQVATIKRFEDGIYNTLITTSIGEEGLDITGCNVAIMYDQGKSSEIRNIQRSGRVARLEAGKIIILLTKDTREIGYYWSSQKKEKTMKRILTKMQESQAKLI